MKWLLVVLAVLPVSAEALNCGKGSYEYRGGCVLDIQPNIAPPVQPSEELPPSDKMPSYQREGVKLVDAPSTAAEDERMDQEKIEATKQGKKAAGIR